MKTIYDVIVVGAGPGGLLTAYLSAKAGLRTLVLERKAEITRKVCGEYLCPKGVALLYELGIGGEILAGFQPIVGMKVTPPVGQQIVGRFDLSGNHHAGTALDRQLFDQRLMTLAQSAGVTILFNQQLKSLTPSDVGHRVETQEHTWCTRLLVGADGRHSSVARLSKLSLPPKKVGQKVAIHFHARGAHAFKDLDRERLGEMHLLSRGRYIGIDPISDEEVNISLVCPSEDLQGQSAAAVIKNALLESAHLKRFADFVDQAHVRAVFPITHLVSAPVARHLALVGDAAGFLDPLTGEGMYNALWMARALTEQLTVHRRHLFSPQAALKEYARLKTHHFRPKVWLNTGFQWLIKYPRLMRMVAAFLHARQERADTFISIIGNILSPLQGLVRIATAKVSEIPVSTRNSV